jgi:hypothetical protein
MSSGSRLSLRIILMFIVATTASIGPLFAHKASDSYLVLQVGETEVTGQWDIALRDLDYALGLDTNNDGVITWGELRSHHLAIADYMLSRLRLRSEGRNCSTRVTNQLVADHSDGSYELLIFAVDCGSSTRELEVLYDFFFDFDPQHRGLLRVEAKGATYSTVFSPTRTTWDLPKAVPSWGEEFAI